MVLSRQEQRILLRAAEYLKDPNHWLKGRLINGITFRGSTRVCALGSIRKACIAEGVVIDNDPDAIYIFDNVRKVLIESATIDLANNASCISIWNDNPHTSHSDVHSAFCKAVKRYVTDPDLLDQASKAD